jgi:hypothetical protein
MSKKKETYMTIATFPAPSLQADDALRLLADLSARRFQGGAPSDLIRLARWPAYEVVRDTLRQAHDQPDALMRLDYLAQHVEEEHVSQAEEASAWQGVVLDARVLVAQVIDAGGSAQTLLAGETDGYRHLCLHCCQDESNFQRVRFFNHHTRRPLLIPEMRPSGRRSMYDRCQICLQALAPVKYVVLIPTGTIKHEKGCTCNQCNQAGFASVVSLYESDVTTHAIRIPALIQVAAPSQQRARKRAFEECWQRGWYLLFDQPSQ